MIYISCKYKNQIHNDNCDNNTSYSLNGDSRIHSITWGLHFNIPLALEKRVNFQIKSPCSDFSPIQILNELNVF